jgi:hypothetical protein
MTTGPIIAEIATLVGEPARAMMLSALRDGRALIAHELAFAARVTPQTDTAGKRTLFNNLNQNEELALRIDETVKNARPDDWRGVQTKKRAIKPALFRVLQDQAQVERMFLTVAESGGFSAARCCLSDGPLSKPTPAVWPGSTFRWAVHPSGPPIYGLAAGDGSGTGRTRFLHQP